MHTYIQSQTSNQQHIQSDVLVSQPHLRFVSALQRCVSTASLQAGGAGVPESPNQRLLAVAHNQLEHRAKAGPLEWVVPLVLNSSKVGVAVWLAISGLLKCKEAR